MDKTCDTCKHVDLCSICKSHSNPYCRTYEMEAWESKDEVIEDNVNSPRHYNIFKTEAIDIIKSALTEEEYRGYLKGNILKYRLRAGWKNNRDEDLSKSNKYQDMLEDTNG